MGMFDVFGIPEYRRLFYLGVFGGLHGCPYIPAIFLDAESSICGHFLSRVCPRLDDERSFRRAGARKSPVYSKHPGTKEQTGSGRVTSHLFRKRLMS